MNYFITAVLDILLASFLRVRALLTHVKNRHVLCLLLFVISFSVYGQGCTITTDTGPICSGTNVTFTAIIPDGAVDSTGYSWGGSDLNCAVIANEAIDGDSLVILVNVNNSTGFTLSFSVILKGGGTINCSESYTVNSSMEITIDPVGANCNNSTFSLSAPNLEAGETGIWTSNNNNVSFSPANTPNTTANGVPLNTPVVATWTVSGSNGCGGGVGTVTLSNNQPSADIRREGDGGNSICEGDSISISVPSAGNESTYNWSGPGISNPLATRTINVTTLVSSGLNTYSVTVTDGNGCANTGTYNLTVAASPSLEVTNNGTLTNGAYCQGSPITLTATSNAPASATFTWEDGTMGPSFVVDNQVPAGGGNFPVMVTVNNSGCATTSTSNLDFHPSLETTITKIAGQTYCAGEETTVGVGGAMATEYTFNIDGTSITTAGNSNLTVTLPTSGDLSLMLTGASNSTSGCSLGSGTTHTIPVDSLPTVMITTSVGQPCEGTPLTMTGNVGGSYVWQFGGDAVAGQTSSTYFIPAVTDSTAGSYTLVFTDNNGCVGEADQVVSFSLPPEPEIVGNEVVCLDQGNLVYSITPAPAATDEVTWTVVGGSFTENPDGTATVDWGTGSGAFSISVNVDATPLISNDGCEGGVTLSIEKDSDNSAPEETGILLFSQPDAAGNPSDFFLVAEDNNSSCRQWYANGSAVNGATFRSLFLPDASTVADVNNGGYLLETWNGDCSPNARTCRTQNFFRPRPPEIITPENAETRLTLFPNPASTHLNLYVQTPPGSHRFDLSILDLTGRRLHSQEVTSLTTELNLELDVIATLPTGYYVLRLTNQLTGKPLNTSFIIAR